MSKKQSFLSFKEIARGYKILNTGILHNTEYMLVENKKTGNIADCYLYDEITDSKRNWKVVEFCK